MNKKNINAVIRKKMNDWWETIEDEELRKDVENNTVVTGGCIASMLLGEPVNDFDVYLQDYQTTLKLAEYYVNQFKKYHKKNKGIEVPIYVDQCKDVRGEDRIRVIAKSAGVASEDDSDADYEYFESAPPEDAQDYVSEVYNDAAEIEEKYEESEKEALEQDGKKYRPVFISTNAITLAGRVQVVLRFVGTPEKIHENYDFVHCTNYWTKSSGVVLRQEALECLLSKDLVYQGSRYPVCSMIRTRKFVQRGWNVNAGQYVKMALQISELDLTSFEVLEDQLTGVDAAYFRQVLKAIKGKENKDITSMYLIEIINRMF